ncbi:hypothetical protein BH23CHL4_BH23CHL4_27600 [soil metagenome]
MEIIMGFAGVFGLGILGALAGFDARILPDINDRTSKGSSQLEDPKSTLSVTRAVLAEKLDPRTAEMLIPCS